MPTDAPPGGPAGAPPGHDGARYDLTVVIPAYNESARIAEPLRRLGAYLAAHHPASELVLADDGSTDDTAAVVERLAGELGLPVRVLTSPQNRGKGHAVRRGMLAARGTLVLMTDADLSTPIDELAHLAAALRAGADVAIGSRKMAGAVIEAHQPWLRENMGKVFTWLTRVFVVDVSDVTCGFKLFRREAAHAVFARATLDDWSFDAEALFLTRRLGFSLVEVPVHWRDAAGTKVNRGRDAVRSAVGLARIVWNRLRGRYDADVVAADAGAAADDARRRRRA
jgi:glycosyltransferase involved in cell wall biosynthesis